MRAKPVRGHGGGRFASSSPGPAPVRGLSTVLPEWRSDRSRPFVSDMCTKFHGATSAPHGGKGETGQGAKEKTPRKGGQHHSSQIASGVRSEPSIEDSPGGVLMKHGRDACDVLVRAHESAGAKEKTPRKGGQHHSSPTASAVRSEPSIEDSPDGVLMKYGHDACDALVGAHESTGAKEVTLQKNPAKQTLPETSAIASNSMIGTISLSTAGSQPPQHDPENDPEKNNRLRNNVAFARGRGSDDRASENDSPVLFSPAVQGREVEPPEGRASSPVIAADVSQNLTTPRGSSKRRPEPTASHQTFSFSTLRVLRIVFARIQEL
jgi:hypothetical protein